MLPLRKAGEDYPHQLDWFGVAEEETLINAYEDLKAEIEEY